MSTLRPTIAQALAPWTPAPELLPLLIDVSAVIRLLSEASQQRALPIYTAAQGLIAQLMDEDAAIAADLHNNRDKAGQAHRAQERSAMRLERQFQQIESTI